MRSASATDSTIAAPLNCDTRRSDHCQWRLLRISVDQIAGGPVTVILATASTVELTGQVEVEITCGLWRKSLTAHPRDHRRLAGDEVEWTLEVEGENPRHAAATATTVTTALLQLATLGDVRHLHAMVQQSMPGKSPPHTRSAA